MKGGLDNGLELILNAIQGNALFLTQSSNERTLKFSVETFS